MYEMSEKQCQTLARHVVDDITQYCKEHAAAFLQFKESLKGGKPYACAVASGGDNQPHEDSN